MMNYTQLPADDGTVTLVMSLLATVAVLSVVGAISSCFISFGRNRLEKWAEAMVANKPFNTTAHCAKEDKMFNREFWKKLGLTLMFIGVASALLGMFVWQKQMHWLTLGGWISIAIGGVLFAAIWVEEKNEQAMAREGFIPTRHAFATNTASRLPGSHRKARRTASPIPVPEVIMPEWEYDKDYGGQNPHLPLFVGSLPAEVVSDMPVDAVIADPFADEGEPPFCSMTLRPSQAFTHVMPTSLPAKPTKMVRSP